MRIVTNESKQTNRDEESKVVEDNSTEHGEKFEGVIRIEEARGARRGIFPGKRCQFHLRQIAAVYVPKVDMGKEL